MSLQSKERNLEDHTTLNEATILAPTSQRAMRHGILKSSLEKADGRCVCIGVIEFESKLGYHQHEITRRVDPNNSRIRGGRPHPRPPIEHHVPTH